MNIEGVPVQFLPAYNPLVEEALARARAVFYERTPTRVLGAERLVAIMLQTGRDKDRQGTGTSVSRSRRMGTPHRAIRLLSAAWYALLLTLGLITAVEAVPETTSSLVARVTTSWSAAPAPTDWMVKRGRTGFSVMPVAIG